MDRHLSADIEFASPSLCSILRVAGLLTPLIKSAYALSHRFNGNEELLERPSGQSFNPRIARITELSLQGGLTSEIMVAAAILGVSKVPVHENWTVQEEPLKAAWLRGLELLGEPGSVLNQAIALDNLRRAHLLEMDSRNKVIAAAEQTVSTALPSPLLPILIKAISRYT